MHIDVSAKNLDLTASLDAYIRRKLGALDKLVRKYEELGEVELKAKIERITAHHHKGDVYAATADLVLPHRDLRAEITDADVRRAIDLVRDKLRAEIKKYRSEH